MIAAARRIGPRVVDGVPGRRPPRRRWPKPRPRRRARLALAALGREWFEADAGPDDPSFDTGASRLSRPGAGGPGRAGRGAMAGGPRGTGQGADRRRGRPNRGGELRKADRLARLLDGAGAGGAGPARPARAPARRARAARCPPDRLTSFRRFQTRAFLLAQAERALEDHWAADPATRAAPYYADAGLAYLNDAEALDIARLWPEGPIAELRGRLTRPDRAGARRAGAVRLDERAPGRFRRTGSGLRPGSTRRGRGSSRALDGPGRRACGPPRRRPTPGSPCRSGRASRPEAPGAAGRPERRRPEAGGGDRRARGDVDGARPLPRAAVRPDDPDRPAPDARDGRRPVRPGRRRRGSPSAPRTRSSSGAG